VADYIAKILQLTLGRLPGEKRGEPHQAGVQRLIFTAVALFNVPLVLVYVVVESDLGLELRQYLQWLGLALALSGYLIARFSRYHVILPRVLFGYLFFLALFQIYYDQDSQALMYLILIPPIVFMLFGQKEGSIWSAMLLLFALPAAFGSEIKYFLVTYLSMTMLGLLLEGIRGRVALDAKKSKSESKEEHERLIALQQELESSESRFRAYSELASDWLFEMDENLTYTFATSRLFEILGGDIKGSNLADLSIELEGDGSSLAPMRRGEEIVNAQVSFRNYRGERVFALYSAKPLRDKDGKFTGYIGAGKDITSIKQAEEELREKDQTLHHMQKLEALGQLTSGVAHDFNNLLTIIGGNMELLELGELSEKESRMVQASTRALDRAGELTQQLLSFSRKQELDPKSVRVGDVFDRLLLMFGRTMEGTIKTEAVLTENLWNCHADEGQLENAILNLALNARDAISGRGEITLGAENFQQTDPDGPLPPGDYVQIWVRDTGVGISDAELNRIMEPFYTTKPIGEGTGLGLSMVYGFARQSHGTLEASSKLGEGSLFSIFLPRSFDTPDERPFEDEISEHVAGRVMVIDDDPDVLSVLQMGLERMGLEVSVFDSAERGFANIEATAPQMIVSDLMLGEGINGAEFADLVTRYYPRIPVLLISGNADQLLSEEDFQRHSINLLRKPFSYHKLREAVQSRLHVG
jgi:PAS domain S-box-containing protein